MRVIYHQYKQYYKQFTVESKSKTWRDQVSFVFSVIEKAFHLFLTQFYLFNIKKGSGVLCRQKPSLQISGELTIGNGVRIWSNIEKTRLSVFKNATLQIGSGTYINGARISAKYAVTIGRNCTIAPEVLIMDSDFHDLYDQTKEGINAKVIIENNVWIANRAIILKGVRIGQHAVVAAGAVVTKEVEPYAIVGGNPARVIRYLNNSSINSTESWKQYSGLAS